MGKILIASLSGMLFGGGLSLAQMTNPAKVLNFLDIGGLWDPSLIFVLVGAIASAASGYKVARSRLTPLAAETFQPQKSAAIDLKLVLGAVMFGIGWGLVGYCPGPALASLTTGDLSTFIFVAAMIVGMVAFQIFGKVSLKNTADYQT